MGPPFLRKAAVPTVAPQPPSPSTVGTALRRRLSSAAPRPLSTDWPLPAARFALDWGWCRASGSRWAGIGGKMAPVIHDQGHIRTVFDTESGYLIQLKRMVRVGSESVGTLGPMRRAPERPFRDYRPAILENGNRRISVPPPIVELQGSRGCCAGSRNARPRPSVTMRMGALPVVSS